MEDEQGRTLFNEGIWHDDPDILGACLTRFAKQHQREPFGKSRIHFSMFEKPIKQQGEASTVFWQWLFASYNYSWRGGAENRRSKYAPYIAVEAERGNKIFVVKLWHNRSYPDALKAYLEKLYHQLCQMGLKPLGEQGEQTTANRVDWKKGRPGRKTEPLYDKAFEMMLNENKTLAEARDWYFQQASISKPEKHDIDSFNVAMRRRKNKKTI